MSALLRRPTPLDADEHLRALEAKGRGPVDAHAAAAAHAQYLEQYAIKAVELFDKLQLWPGVAECEECLAR